MSEIQTEIQRHGTMYLISSSAITLIGFLATIFYAHWVGAGVLGTYFLFVSLFSILCLISDFGITYAGQQRICEGKDADMYYSASLVLRGLIYVLIVLSLIHFRDKFVDINNAGLFWVLVISVGIVMLQTSCGMAIAASNRLGIAASTSFLNNLVRIVVQVIAVLLGFNVSGLIGGLVAGILVQLIIEARFIDYHFRKFSFEHVKRIFSISNWAFFSAAGTALFENANLIIIGYYLPVAEVGIYGICWTLSFFSLFVSSALCNTLLVKVSRWNATGDAEMISRSLSRAITYSMIFSLPMFVGGVILGHDLLYYLYGASFAIGATTLAIIIFMRIFQSIFQLYTNYLMGIDHARQAFYGMGIGCVLNLSVSLILIPKIGITGAAVGALVNIVIGLYICRHYLAGIIPLILEKESLLHIIIASGIMGIVVLGTSLLPIGSGVFITLSLVILGAVTYFVILFILNRQIFNDILSLLKIQWIF